MDTSKKSALKRFFDDRYQGRGENLTAALEPEIAAMAADINLDWDKVSGELSWQAGRKYVSRRTQALQPKNFDAVVVRADYKITDDGITYPLISFAWKGETQAVAVFNGLKALHEEFSRFGAGRIDERTIAKAKAKESARAKALADKRQAARAKAELEEQQRRDNVAKEIAQHNALPPLVSSRYLRVKQLAGIESLVNIRQGTKQVKTTDGRQAVGFMSILLHNIEGQPVGVQRIFDREFFQRDGTLTNKDFTWGMNKVGAHLVIGDLWAAKRVYAGEGFATVATAVLAHQQFMAGPSAGLVAMDADNLLTVITEYKKYSHDLPLCQLVDDDAHIANQGKGNKGRLIAAKLRRPFPNLLQKVPDFSLLDEDHHATDWNDLLCQHPNGLKAVAKQLASASSNIEKAADSFQLALLELKHTPVKQRQKVAMQAVYAGMNLFPEHYTGHELLRMILNVAGTEHVQVKKLKRQLWRIFHRELARAQKFRAFSDRIKNPETRPQGVEYHEFSSKVITPEIAEFIAGLRGVVVVNAPKASGKTQLLQKPIMLNTPKTLYIAHRVSLIGTAHNELNKDRPSHIEPVIHYQDDIVAVAPNTINKLASCVNSIIKPWFLPMMRGLDVLCLDEAAQIVSSVTAGGAMAAPVSVYRRLKQAMVAAQHQVLLCDADANDALVDFCLEVLPQRQERYGNLQKVHVIKLAVDSSQFSVDVTNLDRVYKKIMDTAARPGTKILVATDAAAEGERLAEAMRRDFPEKKILYVSQDTRPEKEVAAFNDRPNDECHKYDVVIYSPAISSGVSITHRHFTHNFGLFRGVVKPSDALQMLHRDRNARHFTIGLGTNNQRQEALAENHILATILANDMDVKLELSEGLDGIMLRTGATDFDMRRIQQLCEIRESCNDFSRVFLLMLMAEHYQVVHLAEDDLEAERGKNMKKVATELNKAQITDRIMAEDTPDDDTREKWLAQRTISREQKAALTRYDIEHQLATEVTPLSITDWLNGLAKQVRRFEVMRISEDEAAKFDHRQQNEPDRAITDRQYLAKNRALLREYLQRAGIDPDTGMGEATQEKLADAMQWLMDGNRSKFVNVYGRWGTRIEGRKSAPDLFKAVIEALGLETFKRRLPRSQGRTWCWGILPQSWEYMDDLHTRRLALGSCPWVSDKLDGAAGESKTIPDCDLGIYDQNQIWDRKTGNGSLLDPGINAAGPYCILDPSRRWRPGAPPRSPMAAIKAACEGVCDFGQALGLLSRGDYDRLGKGRMPFWELRQRLEAGAGQNAPPLTA